VDEKLDGGVPATVGVGVDELGDKAAEGDGEEEAEVGADYRGAIHLLLVRAFDGEWHDYTWEWINIHNPKKKNPVRS
jgi:hypothetical protein